MGGVPGVTEIVRLHAHPPLEAGAEKNNKNINSDSNLLTINLNFTVNFYLQNILKVINCPERPQLIVQKYN